MKYHPYIQPGYSDGRPLCAKCSKPPTDPVHNPTPKPVDEEKLKRKIRLEKKKTEKFLKEMDW